MKIKKGLKKINQAKEFVNNYSIENLFTDDKKNLFSYYLFVAKYYQLKKYMILDDLIKLNIRVFSTYNMNLDFLSNDIIDYVKSNKDYDKLVKNLEFFNDKTLQDIIELALKDYSNNQRSKVFYDIIVNSLNRKEIINLYKNHLDELNLELSYILKLALIDELRRKDLINSIINKYSQNEIEKAFKVLDINDRNAIESHILKNLNYTAVIKLYYNSLKNEPQNVFKMLIEKDYDINKFIDLVASTNCDFAVECISDLNQAIKIGEDYVIEYAIKANQPQLIRKFAKDVMGANKTRLGKEILHFNQGKEIYLYYKENKKINTENLVNRLIELECSNELIDLTPYFKNNNIQKIYYYLLSKDSAKAIFEFSKKCSKKYLSECEKYLKEKDQNLLNEFYNHQKENKKSK